MEQEENKDVKPVKLSIGATMFLVVGLGLIVFILLITFKSCSIEKRVEQPDPLPSETISISTEPEYTETTSKVETEPVSETEIVQPTEVTVTAPPEVATIPETTVPTTEQIVKDNSEDLLKVAEPALSADMSTYGMVTSKSVYKKGTSYVYGVNISLVINEQSIPTEYFCPKKTYDSLNPGDSLNITYSIDSANSISIYSISLS